MARYRATITVPRSPAEAFAYLSDMSNTLEWDPSVRRAQREGDEPVGAGSRFNLVVSFMGRQNEIGYRILVYDPPRAVTLAGQNASVISTDRITIAEVLGGARIDYDAELRLKGRLKIADRLLMLAFRRLGDNALAGLGRALQ